MIASIRLVAILKRHRLSRFHSSQIGAFRSKCRNAFYILFPCFLPAFSLPAPYPLPTFSLLSPYFLPAPCSHPNEREKPRLSPKKNVICRLSNRYNQTKSATHCIAILCEHIETSLLTNPPKIPHFPIPMHRFFRRFAWSSKKIFRATSCKPTVVLIFFEKSEKIFWRFGKRLYFCSRFPPEEMPKENRVI